MDTSHHWSIIPFDSHKAQRFTCSSVTAEALGLSNAFHHAYVFRSDIKTKNWNAHTNFNVIWKKASFYCHIEQLVHHGITSNGGHSLSPRSLKQKNQYQHRDSWQIVQNCRPSQKNPSNHFLEKDITISYCIYVMLSGSMSLTFRCLFIPRLIMVLKKTNVVPKLRLPTHPPVAKYALILQRYILVGVFGNKLGNSKLKEQTRASIHILFCQMFWTPRPFNCSGHPFSKNLLHMHFLELKWKTNVHLMNAKSDFIARISLCGTAITMIAIWRPVLLFTSSTSERRADRCSPSPFEEYDARVRDICKVKHGPFNARSMFDFAEN